MKMNGLSFDGPKPVTCVIPIGNQELVFTIKPVVSYEEFDEVCPRPEPPGGIDGKGNKEKNYKHPTYLEAVDVYSQRRMDWMYLKALEDTEGLEWETVDMKNPETFQNFAKEMEEAGVPVQYIDHFKFKIIQICGLDPQRIDEATERFLASREQEQKS